MLRFQALGVGYIAVLLPDTQLPTPDKKENWETIQQNMKKETNICYAFIRGQCSRGESCKFQHQSFAPAGNTEVA